MSTLVSTGSLVSVQRAWRRAGGGGVTLEPSGPGCDSFRAVAWHRSGLTPVVAAVHVARDRSRAVAGLVDRLAADGVCCGLRALVAP